MGMGQTGRAPWVIGTHTSMLLDSSPYCYEVLIEEKQTSGQEPQCGNEGEKTEVKWKVLYILEVRVQLTYLSIYGKRWAYIGNTK